MVDASLLRLVEVAVERKWLQQQVALQSAASVTHIVKYVQKVNYYKGAFTNYVRGFSKGTILWWMLARGFW